MNAFERALWLPQCSINLHGDSLRTGTSMPIPDWNALRCRLLSAFPAVGPAMQWHRDSDELDTNLRFARSHASPATSISGRY
ncbi:hypothetical protein OH77DRAFT_944272 [Trametes cingulata]|nr:hypothetical protein OH77DRAFT_944272 [Trametes cingulata]